MRILRIINIQIHNFFVYCLCPSVSLHNLLGLIFIDVLIRALQLLSSYIAKLLVSTFQ